MIETQKVYLCNTEDPVIAARLYDIAVIQTRGLKAKVNFDYNKAQLLAILLQESLLKIKDDMILFNNDTFQNIFQ